MSSPPNQHVRTKRRRAHNVENPVSMKNVYFLSDAHLGSLAIPHGRTQERRLVRFLDSIKEKAEAIRAFSVSFQN